MSFTPVSGKNGTLVIGTTTLAVSSFSYTHSCGVAEVTNSTSAGYYVDIPTITKVDFTADVIYDAGALYSVVITPGGTGTITFTADGTHGITFTARFDNVAVSMDVKGAITYKLAGHSVGAVASVP